MQLLYRINRTGTTVLVATHDSHMVDRMRRRVIELERGRIVRDEADAMYGRRGGGWDMNTAEFGALMRGEPGVGGDELKRMPKDPFDEVDEAWR
jgi:cell division transport system ATP-binding protein